MKKQTLLLLFLICCSYASFADKVERNTAETVAYRFLNAKAPGSNVAGMQALIYMGDTTCYVFNFKPGGFVIISAEDAAIPVIGYSIEGQFRSDNSPVVEAYFNAISSQIHEAKVRRVKADARINSAWQNLLESEKYSVSFSKLAAAPAVEGMINLSWGQDAPYNILCPDSACDRGPGTNTRTLTGCVATSMAMVMRYYNYPSAGSGSRNGVEFNTQYNWQMMPAAISASSSQTQKEAVATIMRHAGAAVDMQYSCSYSGASLALARTALIQYFNFSSSVGYLFRDMGTDQSWHSMLKSDIANGRPIIYGGLDSEGALGHAFILDGYDQGPDVTRYHINWGWNGYLNGFFAIDSLTPYPAADFNHHQSAILGIVPPASQPRIATNMSSWSAPDGGGISSTVLVTNTTAGDPTVINYTITTSASWLQTNSAAGVTPGTFRISAAANPNSSPRSAFVTITSTTPDVLGSPITIQVSQNQGSASGPVLAVAPTIWAASIGGGTSPAIQVSNATVSDTTVIDYDVISNVTWLSVSENQGSTPGSFEITANSNGTGLSRTGRISVSTNTQGVLNKTVFLEVSQPGEQQSSDTISVSPPSWATTSIGGLSPMINVSVGSRSLSYSVSSSVTWLTSSSTNGTTPGGFTLSADENTSGAARSATVTITINAAGVFGSPFQFQVAQGASTKDPILVASKSTVSFSNQGGDSESISVTNSNPTSSESIQYFITETLPWITVTSALGTTPGTFLITAEENPGEDFRSGTVTIKAQDPTVLGSPWLITVSQGVDIVPDQRTLSVAPRFWTAPSNGGESSEISISNSSSSNTNPIPYTISDDADWLTVSSNVGSTPSEITLFAETNNGSSVRFAVVRISSPSSGVEGSPQDIYVTQAPASGDAALLGISPSTVVLANVASTSGPILVYNASQKNTDSFDFKVDDKVPWITVSKFKGTAPDTLRIEVGSNDSDTARTGVISISAVDGSVFASPQELRVYQTASLAASLIGVSLSRWETGPVSSQSPTVHVLGSGGSRGIPYRIRSDVPWLSTTWTYGNTPGLFNIIASANNKGESRTGRIYVADYQHASAGAEHVIIVKQSALSGYPILDVSMDSWDAPVSDATSPTVYVINANSEYEGDIQYIVSSDVSWLRTSTISGTTPGEFVMLCSANDMQGSRSGTVTVRSIGEGIINDVKTISVRQGGLSSVLLSCSSSSSKSPDVDTRPGDRFRINVSLSQDVQSNGSSNLEINFLLHYDYAGLYPVDVSATRGSAWLELVNPGIMRVHIKDRTFASGQIASIRFETLLGNSKVTTWSLSEPLIIPAVSELGLDLSCRGDVFLSPRNGFTTRKDLGIASLSSIFPNPAPAKSSPGLTVEVEQAGFMDIKMYNGMGTLNSSIYSGQMAKGTHHLSINHNGLSAGVYILVMRTAQGTKTQSFVISR
jgi:peptidase C10-like protein/Spi protease inhibitor/all-beta uncharacterized protein